MVSFPCYHITEQAADKPTHSAEFHHTFFQMEEVSASSTASTASTVVKRKGRATKQFAEAYCFVLSLSWNDIVVNGGKMSTKQQEELIKVKAAQWVPELRKTYAHCFKVSCELEAILTEIDSDNGEQMIRKAKAIIHYVNNILNPSWKDPTSFASGNQLPDALLICRKAAWSHNETERIKLKKDKTVELTHKEFDQEWTFKEWPCFRFLGLPAGARGCLEIFRSTTSGSGPSQLTKRSSAELREQMAATGSRDQRKLAGLKSVKQEVNVKEVEEVDDEIEILRGGWAAQQEMTTQVAWNNEMKRLETVLDLAKSLNLPEDKVHEHKMNLYNFAMVPCPTSGQLKCFKREERSTPASAIMAAKGADDDQLDFKMDRPSFENLTALSKVTCYCDCLLQMSSQLLID